MKTVRFNGRAEKELSEAASHYEAERTGLGDEFLTEIYRAITFLLRFPDAAPKVRGPIRSFVVSRFPYSILFRTLKNRSLRILAIAHHRRRPGYWEGRR